MSAKWAWGGLNWHYMYTESGYLVHCVNILTLIAIFLTKPTMLMWSPYMHLYVYLIINIVTSGNHYMYVEGDCPKNIDPTTQTSSCWVLHSSSALSCFWWQALLADWESVEQWQLPWLEPSLLSLKCDSNFELQNLKSFSVPGMKHFKLWWYSVHVLYLIKYMHTVWSKLTGVNVE